MFWRMFYEMMPRHVLFAPVSALSSTCKKKKTGSPVGLKIFNRAASEAISLQIHPCSQMMNLSAINTRPGYPTDFNNNASGLPSKWDEIMNHSSGTRREPR